MTPKQREALKERVKIELKMRGTTHAVNQSALCTRPPARGFKDGA